MREEWATVGPRLLRDALGQRRVALEDAFHDAEDALCGAAGTEPMLTPADVRALRERLHAAQWTVETYVAPVAGVEPWGELNPRIPMHVLYEATEHPNADGVDPREYVDASAEVPDE